MTGAWEEFDALYTLIVTGPCVDPLLWDECIVVFVTQVAWRLNETTASLVKDTTIAVVDRRWLKKRVATWVLQFGICKTLLTLLLKGLHQSLLLVGEHAATLVLKLLHALISGPGPFKVSRARIAIFLPLRFEITAPCLLGQGLGILLLLSSG